MKYSKIITKINQRNPIIGKNMVENNAGGYTFELGNIKKLERFLILGTSQGSCYQSAEELTLQNTGFIVEMIEQGRSREIVKSLLKVSLGGLARKVEGTIFVVALILTFGDNKDKRYIVEERVVNKICRTGTHLFILTDYIKDMRGWGSIIKEVYTNWYLDKETDKLTYQMIKYQSRHGWSHRDLLRLNHIKTDKESMDMLFSYIVKKEETKGDKSVFDFEELKYIQGFELAKREEDIDKLIQLIKEYRLIREMIPTLYLNKPSVQEVLLENMGLIALIRNLGAFTASGLISEYNFAILNRIVDRIVDEVEVKKSRIHPLQILDALMVYSNGSGQLGRLSWTPVRRVIDGLNKCFYLSFGNVEATGKNIYLAIDVSGSMDWINIEGSMLTPRVASAALALVTANIEKNYVIKAFSDRMVDLDISPEMTLNQVLEVIDKCQMGGTDCSLPMIDAIEKGAKDFDAFVVYTDNETWYGDIHPCAAIKEYRRFAKKRAKLISVGMVSNGFSIAEPSDGDMLDIVGFSSAMPQVMAEFILDRI